ncbi:MAG: type II secretion system F family protein [Lachnospiraceae bacterium]|nr:type II secretion system F family protein [Lachnospiraceae bacterium]
MIAVYMLIMAAYGILACLSLGEDVRGHEKEGPVKLLFLRMSLYLMRKGEDFSKRTGFRGNAYFAARRGQLSGKLRILNPSENEKKQLKEHRARKLSLVLMAFLGAVLISAIAFSEEEGRSELVSGKYLKRGDYGEGSRTVSLTADIDGNEEPVEIDVESIRYSTEELDSMYEKFSDALPGLIAGKNESLSYVTKDLALKKKYSSWPYTVSWETDDYELVNTQGKVNNSGIEGHKTVNLTAVCSAYGNEKRWTTYLAADIYAPELTRRETIRKNLEEAIRMSDDSTITEDALPLPEGIEEGRITWKEETARMSGILLLAGVAAAIALSYARDASVNRAIRERERQLVMDYPTLVTRITLYMGAGMSLSGIFSYMAESARKQGEDRTNYLNREICRTENEIQSGIPEDQAVENFGRRCGLRPYIRLSTLLSQNVRKGNSLLVQMLMEESDESLTERRNLARKMGEEAGTKLLLPMILMLMVVMVIIMVPAFASFGV